MKKNVVDRVRSLLFTGDAAGTFAVLDGAAIPDLRRQLWEHKPQYECLFRGELKPDMAEVAPYLVKLEPRHPFTAFVLDSGWGQHWSIFAQSASTLPELRRHFRTFFLVHDNNNRPLYFRYYDPRVLRVFLPTCNEAQLQTMFGPVTGYIVEDEQPAAALRFRIDNTGLRQERVPLESES
jgi:hypothetical protein